MTNILESFQKISLKKILAKMYTINVVLSINIFIILFKIVIYVFVFTLFTI